MARFRRNLAQDSPFLVSLGPSLVNSSMLRSLQLPQNFGNARIPCSESRSTFRFIHWNLRNAIDEGAFLVRQHWPEAMADMLTNIVAFSPLVRQEIEAPDPESIPAFRGLVRTSAQPHICQRRCWCANAPTVGSTP
jgi:hypothetical protein